MKKKTLLFSLFPVVIVIYFFYLIFSSHFFFHYDSYFEINNGDITFLSEKPQGWQKLSSIPKTIQWPIILSEDWAYFDHKGIDFQQLKKVLDQALSDKKIKRGASTISQQVVKNLYLHSQKSLKRKIDEWILTILLELFTSKQWILEQYLNLVELGPGIYGVKNASFYYFGQPMNSLNYRHGAFLAMLLPSPIRYGESFRKKQLTAFASERIEQILEKLVIAKVISAEEKIQLTKEHFSWESAGQDKDRLPLLPYWQDSESEYDQRTLEDDILDWDNPGED